MKKSLLFACLALGMLAGTTLAQSPDMIIDQSRLASSLEFQTATFATDACAIVENCAGAGTRRLLKFDVGLINAGDGDLVLGDPNANPDLFQFSPCHGHFHLKGVADYQLISSNGDTVVTARKQAFCLRDDIAALSGAGAQKFTCDFQGITSGWEDVYDKSLDCQWLDVTGVPDGDYILRVVCNPEGVFIESNYDNNSATATVTISTPKPPPPPTNANCKCTCNCKKKCQPKKPWNWNKLSQKFKAQWVKKWENCCTKDKSGKSKCGCQTKPGAKGKCGCKAKGNCCKPNPKGCGCRGNGTGNDDQGGKGDDD